MKLNIAYPANGTQKCFELSRKDEQKLYSKKIGDQFDGGLLFPEFEGSILQINGGNDYQGFCMSASYDTDKRRKELLKEGDVGYKCRVKGVRKRKSVRGSRVSNEIQVLNMSLIRENKVIEGLTDCFNDKSHLPKRLSKLCKEFGLPEGSNIRKFIKENREDTSKRMPRLRVILPKDDKIAERKEADKKAKLAQKEKIQKEREEYLAKYGSIRSE
ncbi:RS6 [Hepatospora eriocheir]|uniref:RS6 n=1 Tax=Hepatospora eriocheir TaxID=1081669 RepID=A0A1X0QHC7_9MICR|nr:RS6 [Hepatospora eriocheir]ORD99177.1 RS6 [Hepatospora eriocheir]